MLGLSRNAEKLAVSTYLGISYKSADDDPIHPTETIATGFGMDTESEIRNAVEKMLSNARENVIIQDGEKHLVDIIKKRCLPPKAVDGPALHGSTTLHQEKGKRTTVPLATTMVCAT